MVDLHSHVLFGIDDGPPGVEGSLAIARAAVAGGTRTLVATPHASSRYANDAETIAPVLEVVRERVRDEGLALALLAGAEVAITHVPEMGAEQLAPLSLGGGGWLLVEPPFSPVATGLETSVLDLMSAGHRVVLAHPERCPALHRTPAIVGRLVDAGALTSVTAGSLAGRFGNQARRFAIELLDAGLAHNVASDAHDDANRPPLLMPGIEAAGFAALAGWLTEEVPGAIVSGETVPPRPRFRRPSRRWPWPRPRSA